VSPLRHMAAGWMPRSWLPNAEGQRVVVLLDSGEQVQSEVVRDGRRLHHLKDVEFARVVGWRRCA
jgi:hypothetical protein